MRSYFFVVSISFLLAATAAGVAQDQPEPLAQTPPDYIEQPRQETGLQPAEGDVRRPLLCDQSCRIVRARPIVTEICKPFVAEGLPPPPVQRRRWALDGPECVRGGYSVQIRQRSPRCWVSNHQYCTYRPEGRSGYPCTCGRRSGYFG